MRIYGKRSDGAVAVDLGGPVVVMLGNKISPPSEPTAVDRMGPWETDMPRLTGAEQRRLSARLSLARGVPLSALTLLDGTSEGATKGWANRREHEGGGGDTAEKAPAWGEGGESASAQWPKGEGGLTPLPASTAPAHDQTKAAANYLNIGSTRRGDLVAAADGAAAATKRGDHAAAAKLHGAAANGHAKVADELRQTVKAGGRAMSKAAGGGFIAIDDAQKTIYTRAADLHQQAANANRAAEYESKKKAGIDTRPPIGRDPGSRAKPFPWAGENSPWKSRK